MYIKVTKTKNGCGGIYRMGTFSIDWRIKTGALLGASADGRLTKTPISKNISADIARDRECITAHIMSALKLNYEDMPNGTVLNIVIHVKVLITVKTLLIRLRLMHLHQMQRTILIINAFLGLWKT